MKVKLAPSILSADFARLADAVAEAEAGGADWIHVDVMDGHFVPNLTIGPQVVKALRRVTRLPLDVHLMIERPDRYLDAFAEAGADVMTVHQEACVHLHRTVERIHQLGKKAGIAINPATPAAVLSEILPYVDLALVMSVNPGFGGQAYIPTSGTKVGDIAKRLAARGLAGVEIEVDGGVDPETAPGVVEHGATVLVAGAAIFGGDATVAENIRRLRDAIEPVRR
ncbi:MAG: ribulose-phosphate 3-epimerase [Gemmatimonadetes bacterium]|nr:ribulose-phosphate 3-epimerase [Gemmatimonadota bacterium]